MTVRGTVTNRGLLPSDRLTRRCERVPRDGRTVLIIDDHAGCREVAQRVLRRAGHAVRTAASGREGLALAERLGDALALVLLDWQMPELSGAQTLRRLRKLRTEVPVVVVSGVPREEVLGEVPAAWISGHVRKPWFGSDLRATVQSFLAAPREEQQDASASISVAAGA